MSDNRKNVQTVTDAQPKQSHMARGPMRGGVRMIEKPKNFKAAIKQLLKFAKNYVAALIIATILAIISVATIVAGPSRLQEVTNLISSGATTGNMDMAAISRICVVLLCLYVISFLTHCVQDLIFANVSQRIAQKLRREIDKKINRLPLKYFDDTTYGDVLSRVTNDVDTIGQILHNNIAVFVRQLIFLSGSLVMMFITSYIMAFTAVGSTVVGIIIMLVIIKVSQKYFKRQQEGLGALNGHVEEIYSGHNVVKAYGGEKDAILEFNKINDGLYLAAWKSQFISGLMQPVMGFVGNFGYVMVCVVGGSLAINGNIQLGVIVAFMIYIRYFTNPLSQIAQAATTFQSMAAASERVFEFLEAEEMTPDHPTCTLDNVKGDVEFKNIVFGYDPQKVIIHGFNAKVKAGQKIAIVGPTGAGKTTIVNLLMRFYELNSGEITVDGVSLTDLTRKNVHDLFGMVLQDTWIFEGTIFDNVRYSKTDVPEEKVIAACKAVGLDHFIKTLPKGYNTVLDDKSGLSQGQKQLLTIARAMVEDAPMLILDEATSSVDTRTEEVIQQAMDRLMKGRTSFIIAHRLSTIKNADLILVLKDGDVIEHGTHEQLLAQNGFYAELYNSQFKH